MTTRNSQIRPVALEIKPGVHPSTDSTPLATECWTMSQGIRMFNGVPRKIGGHVSLKFTTPVTGVIRSIYTTIFGDGTPQLLFGTDRHLYNASGSILTNITPFGTTSQTITNVASHRYNLTNPITTTAGSSTVRVTDANASYYKAGETVTFSGATAINGISAAVLNAPHAIKDIDATGYTFFSNDVATSSGTGVGTVTVSNGLLTITHTAHGLVVGDRVKTTAITDTGGILAAQANGEFIIRNVTANTFDVMTAGTSTSQTSTTNGSYVSEIPPGPDTEYVQQGYGAGLYGAGLYGASGVSQTRRVTPRIWFMDKFADAIITTPGDIVYSWNGSTVAAPVPLAGAPTGVNYAFVFENFVVTLGAQGVGNQIFTSDQGNPTIWTASSLNQVFQDSIEGAAQLISHAPVTGQALLFTETQTYTLRYVGREAGVFQIKPLDLNTGLIAPLARVSVNGTAYWMSKNNFHMYRGGNVEIIPAATQSFTTLLNYVFDNLNRDQDSKCFAEFNPKYNEVWFHYPTLDSDEPNAVARVSLTDYSWTPDRMDRTAAEQNGFFFNLPHLANQQTIYQHEVGNDADGQPLPWMIQTNLRSSGKNSTAIVNLVPDALQTGDVNILVTSMTYPNSQAPVYENNFVYSDTSENVPVDFAGHFWRYKLSGAELGQAWQMGQFYEYIQGSSPQ